MGASVIFAVIKNSPKLNSVWVIYVVYTLALFYSVVTSAFVSPEFVSVSMLALIVQIPMLFLDKSWRINLFVILITLIYLACIFPFKDRLIFLDEAVNAFAFAAIALIVGQFTRSSKLENYTMKATLRHFAYTDQLTELSNRRQLFLDFAECENPAAENTICGLGIFDVDFFKNYNDTYGHLAGDDCLKSIAKVFSDYQSNYNVHFYRYGGEEFLIVFRGYSQAHILEITDSVRRSIEGLRIKHDDTDMGQITVSVGLAVFRENEEKRYESLLSRADKALYAAKSRGRNQTVMYDDSMSSVVLEANKFR